MDLVGVLLLFIFTLAILLIFVSILLNEKSRGVYLIVQSILIAILIYITFYIYFESIKPIDVYRGKTTLEITYRNGVAIDSVVVSIK